MIEGHGIICPFIRDLAGIAEGMKGRLKGRTKKLD